MALVLAVDDSSFQLKAVVRILESGGHEVFTAKNGQLGLDAFAERKPDLIVSDLLMPVMDGFEMIEKLQINNTGVPIVVVSADIQESTRERVLALGVCEVIAKPPDKEFLLATICKALS
ncbi:MAG: response regulator [Planctomycetes bacterium]|nr:response regulator [Planctomycetota bacterium]